MKNAVKNILSLTLISAVIGILLAVTNYFTAPLIEAQQNAAVNDALLVVMPDGGNFELLDLTGKELPASVNEAYAAENGGYVVRLTVTGYQPGMVILCGVRDGLVTGVTCVTSGETLGYEKTYGDRFPGLDTEAAAKVDTVAGATKTTKAYRDAVVAALNTATILSGGEADLRDEAEILRDNLNAALPAGEGEFIPWFVTGLEGVDAVYLASNGAGAVYFLSESYVGIGADGAVQGDADDILSSQSLAAHETLRLTAVDLSAYEGIPKHVTAAAMTADGSYLFNLQASGFGIQGDGKWIQPNGEYIVIQLLMSPEGKIITAKTVSQAESVGYGAACGEESFYAQFDGKTADDYRDIDGISGATITTNAYKTAIGKAFEALTILKGGAAE